MTSPCFDAIPKRTGVLSAGLESRLPDKKIDLKESEPLQSVLARLAQEAEIRLFVDPRISGDFRAEPGT